MDVLVLLVIQILLVGEDPSTAREVRRQQFLFRSFQILLGPVCALSSSQATTR